MCWIRGRTIQVLLLLCFLWILDSNPVLGNPQLGVPFPDGKIYYKKFFWKYLLSRKFIDNNWLHSTSIA